MRRILFVVVALLVAFAPPAVESAAEEHCKKVGVGKYSGRLTCKDTGPSTDPGPVWRKPGVPNDNRVRLTDDLPDDRSKWNWYEIMYYSETQSPCWGIDDPNEYLECQIAPWVEAEDPTVTMTPEEAVESVVTHLDFVAAMPHLGPNRTHHSFPFDTAVGYPVWLWASGGTDSKSVSETAGGLNVSISIRLSSVVWELGDGTRIRCNKGIPWRLGTTAGRPSPTCGHVYTQPGAYTVVATSNWELTWAAGGESGTIDHSIPVRHPFEVGEIHVLVR